MEFETLYKQTFAQVRCPACVAVAAQPAPRRRFGWVICLAAPLLLAAGVLARVEFTNLHNTPHPSYAPDAVGGYALHYTLTTHPLDTLGEAVQTLAAEERQPAFQRMRTPDHYSFSPVSYTHLVSPSVTESGIPDTSPSLAQTPSGPSQADSLYRRMVSVSSVSYTHLDVYKRQPCMPHHLYWK